MINTIEASADKQSVTGSVPSSEPRPEISNERSGAERDQASRTVGGSG